VAFLETVSGTDDWTVLACAIVGSALIAYVAMEIIEEVRNMPYMLVLLSGIVIEFIVFFAFQYWYLLLVQPASFPTLATDPTSLLLHSTMVFAFNPLYLPETLAGRALLLVNTLGALGIVLFIFQNVSQIQHKMHA
jgi:hypothetical protein